MWFNQLNNDLLKVEAYFPLSIVVGDINVTLVEVIGSSDVTIVLGDCGLLAGVIDSLELSKDDGVRDLASIE